MCLCLFLWFSSLGLFCWYGCFCVFRGLLAFCGFALVSFRVLSFCRVCRPCFFPQPFHGVNQSLGLAFLEGSAQVSAGDEAWAFAAFKSQPNLPQLRSCTRSARSWPCKPKRV